MEGEFIEFENENVIRSYPFAAGCSAPDGEREIPSGVFIDAVMYPVNPTGVLYLSSVTDDGKFIVSDDTGEVMSGVQSGSCVELYDSSSFGRHLGTLLASSVEELSDFAGRRVLREYSSSETAFSASCVFPVVVDGVRSISVGGLGRIAGEMSFGNSDSDEIRVSSGEKDGMDTLRFDVLPVPDVKDVASIRRIICVVDGQTPFRIVQDDQVANKVLLSLFGIDRETVCAAAHRESVYEMTDTCECEKDPLPTKIDLPETYQLVEVYIPPDEDGSEGGSAGGMSNAFFFGVGNYTGVVNPLSITMEDGVVAPKVSDPEVVFDGQTADIAEGELLDDMTSKGVVLQVPGLSGGEL